MTNYDYAVIGAYFLVLISVGMLTSRLVSTTSDYFRGGGTMVWWIVGASAFMNQFSAWTFTGAASSAYSAGWVVATIYFGNGLGFFFNYLYFAARSRQMRVITTIEAVRERFGVGTQQFYTWVGLPVGIFSASIWLNGLCIFISVAFDIPLEPTLLVTGTVVVVTTLLGGAWASSSNDFVQLLVLVPVTIVAAVLALREVGGVDGFAGSLPAGHLDISAPFASGLLVAWCATNLVRQFVNCNNLMESARYLAVKNHVHARRAALLACVLSFAGPFVWFIPPMVARILYPDLGAVFPGLNNPAEGAFAAICLKVLPTGMLGLMICGMLGATVSSMDTGLNRNAGIFVRNFYLPILRPNAGERELVIASRLATMLIGMLIIAAALSVSRMKSLGLFAIMQQFGALVLLPMSVPMMLVVVVRRAPAWAAWSTTLVCFVTSLVVGAWLTPAWFEGVFGRTLSEAQQNYWTTSLAVTANVVVGTAWFCATRWAWRFVPAERRAEIASFNERIRTPLTDEETSDRASDGRQARLMGGVAIVFGLFIGLMILIPNPAGGRLAFAFCSGFMLLVGGLLFYSGRDRAHTARPY